MSERDHSRLPRREEEGTPREEHLHGGDTAQNVPDAGTFDHLHVYLDRLFRAPSF